MKFKCGPIPSDFVSWRRWFAWYPVKVSQGDCRWLEFVERKMYEGYDDHWYLYRAVGSAEADG